MKNLHYPGNHDDVITHLEPNILECEVKWALESIIRIKTSGGDGIPAELFQFLKMMLSKCHTQYASKFGKLQQWPQDWKRSVFVPNSKRVNAKECSNYCTISCISHATKVMLKILQGRLQKYVNEELSDVKAGFRKAEEPEIKLPTYFGSQKKQESSRKTSSSALLTTPKPLTVWVTTVENS